MHKKNQQNGVPGTTERGAPNAVGIEAKGDTDIKQLIGQTIGVYLTLTKVVYPESSLRKNGTGLTDRSVDNYFASANFMAASTFSNALLNSVGFSIIG